MTATQANLENIMDRIHNLLMNIIISESDDESEKNWLIKHTLNPELKKLAPQLSILSLHALEVISANEGIKGIDIAKELNVTKGAVSKATRKLLDHGLIRKEQRPDNQKEIYYYLTPLGEELAELHRQMHLEKDKQALELLKDYDMQSLELITDFLEKMARLR